MWKYKANRNRREEWKYLIYCGNDQRLFQDTKQLYRCCDVMHVRRSKDMDVQDGGMHNNFV